MHLAIDDRWSAGGADSKGADMTRTQRSAPEATSTVSGDPPGAEASALGFERVVFFSDAVFAIVITLLVLPLTAEIELPETGEGLARQVWAMWPTALTFAVSFLVIGQFWIAHHRTFGHIRRQDTGLVWCNLLALLTVAFLPFPAALLGTHSTTEDAFAVVFYAASLTVTSAAVTGTWLYAVRRQLVDESLAADEQRTFTRRALATTAVFAASIGAAFLGLLVAVACWVVVLPAVRLAASRRRAARLP